MQFERKFAEAIRAGDVTTSFRRWLRPQVVAGRRYRVPWIGFIDVTRVETVTAAAITAADARRAGFDSVRELLAYLDEAPSAARSGKRKPAKPGAELYRVDLRWCGEDAAEPRAELAARTATADESAALRKRLDAMDARSMHGAWTRGFLALIAAAPGTRAADLAARVGWDVPTFKAHVRKLKTLGLTESLEVGYRLSPRGADFVRTER